MHKAKIFLLGGGDSDLIALEETEYVTESVLQDFLARYPDLLPGDQIDPENPRRWMLVAREIGIPGDETESGRWSLDHLFLDQDGIPTFVECKRATDTRNRREVVAQMLDYAANGIEYWSIDKLRQATVETVEAQGISIEDALKDLIGEESTEEDFEEFWDLVESNLRSRKVRLIFASDSTPRELRRLIEFLNEEMTNVEVLGVEIKQFQRSDAKQEKALVPRVIGFTETARSVKRVGAKRPRHTTPEVFFSKCPSEAVEVFQNILDGAKDRGHVIYWGEVGFSVRYQFNEGKKATFLLCYPPDLVQFYFTKDGVLSREKESPLRKELLSLGVFRESGEYTLSVNLSESDLGQMKEVYTLILSRIDEQIRT